MRESIACFRGAEKGDSLNRNPEAGKPRLQKGMGVAFQRGAGWLQSQAVGEWREGMNAAWRVSDAEGRSLR